MMAELSASGAGGPEGRERDWTVDPGTGRSNSSAEYLALVGHLGRLIRDSAFDLIGGRADRVAHLIVAQLAHEHGMVPASELEAAEAARDEALAEANAENNALVRWVDRAERAESLVRAAVEALRGLVGVLRDESAPTFVCSGCGGPWPCAPSEWDSRHQRVLGTHVEDAVERALALAPDNTEAPRGRAGVARPGARGGDGA